MLTVAPGATFEAVTARFAHSATVGVRIRDNAGADFLARTVTGVTEDLNVAATALFRRSFTAPTTQGQWTIVWDDGTTIDTEELVVTSDLPAVIGSGHLYVSREQLKTIIGRQNESYADAAIDIAIDAASRMIEGYKNDTRFYPTAEVRYYTAEPFASRIRIDDLVSLVSLTVDRDNDGTYETTLVESTDFLLDPPNAALQGRPYTSIALRTGLDLLPYGADTLPNLIPHVRFPSYQRGIRVEGTFGWATAPIQVTQAAVLLANRFVARIGQAPLAVIVKTAAEAVATARLGAIDPDVKELLDSIVGINAPLFV